MNFVLGCEEVTWKHFIHLRLDLKILLGSTRTSLSLWLILLHYWDKILLINQYLMTYKSLPSYQWEQKIFPALCEIQRLFTVILLNGSYLGFLKCILWNRLIYKEDLLQISGVLLLCSPLLSLLWELLPWFSALSSKFKRPMGFAWVSSPCYIVQENLSRQ